MPESYRITTIDVHVAGEPLRVIIEGFPEPEGNTILQKRQFCHTHLDHLRRALMLEPRGHQDMYGCLLVTPTNTQADFGVLFMHNEGYSTMCGHGIIGVVTVILEHGLFRITEPETAVKLETPSGLVTARASVHNGRVRSVAFQNVPSFVVDLDQVVEVPGIGPIQYDLAFGGAFYGFCQAYELGLKLIPEHAQKITELGMRIKRAIMASRKIEHPAEADLGFLYGIIFVGAPMDSHSYSRQVCIFADGAMDRSPTGTGVSAHLALLYRKGHISAGKKLHFQSILGTQFAGTVVKETTVGGQQAIIPEVEGKAFITGRHEFFIDPDDPLRDGFLPE